MKYYIYIIELDIIDKINELGYDNEQSMLMLKTNGQCVLEYTKEEYNQILNSIGTDNASILEKRVLSLTDIRAIYDNVEMSTDDGYIREFKLKIYPAINECKGIVILEQNDTKEKQSKKWFEFWK